ncbi:HAD family hydrolase [Natribaculum luteum]|uniref:HAD family hydrolase n=1 Tax=Natribaculum luteum TaxID=1586232 RepID=A0ABD5NV30_9EURY|nr:HAD family hydrolase [Natribaculum luteum]
MSTPSAVLFDLDGTLCTYERPGSEILEAAFDRLGLEPRFEMADFHERYLEFLPASADGFDLYERTFTALCDEHDLDPSLGERLNRAFHDERDPDDLVALEGAHEVLTTFEAEYRLGLVTNGHPELQRHKLRTLAFPDVFETVVFAGYDTPAKPDPEPFRRALTAVETSPAEAVYVGNHPSVDVAGARAAGLRAAWLADADRRPSPRPDYVLESLHELRAPPWRGD